MRQNSFQQKGLIEGMGFVFLIGLDRDYNYLKEILFWDPVSASWYDMRMNLHLHCPISAILLFEEEKNVPKHKLFPIIAT